MALNLNTETSFTNDNPAIHPPLPPELIAPHFPQLEILECLGRGGMGVVYKARQKNLNRFVALKLLAPEREKDPAFSNRFEREAHALAALNHPNIVTIYDFGQAGGFYYLLMEFVDGANLRQLLRERKFTPEEALAIVPPLCDALQFAHDQGIVHRDIKPENLLLDKAGRVKVADFGIAKILGTVGEEQSDGSVSAENNTQHAVGTPGYSAPEQKSDPQRVDNRADIYSLGVVFYEMLTGELPGKTLTPPSRKVRIDVRLDEIVLRALEKKPELRYQQASHVKTLVETIAATPTVSDRRQGAQPENEKPNAEANPVASGNEPSRATPQWWSLPQPALRPLAVLALLIFLFVFRQKLFDLHPVIVVFVIGLGIGLNYLIIRRVWREMKKSAENTPPESSQSKLSAAQSLFRQPFEQVFGPQKPSRFWRWFALLGLAAIFMLIVAWSVTSKHAADSQQQARGALQIELGSKLADLLGNNNPQITYSSIKFDFVPDAPRILVHYDGLKGWHRGATNETPLSLHGDIVLSFQSPDWWLATGAGDLAEINTSFQTAARGYVWWSGQHAEQPLLRVTIRVLDAPAGFDDSRLLRPSGLLDAGDVKILAAPYVVVPSGSEGEIHFDEVPRMNTGFSHILSGRTRTLFVKPTLAQGSSYVHYSLEGLLRGGDGNSSSVSRSLIRSDSLRLGELGVMESNGLPDGGRQLAVICVEMAGLRADGAGTQ